jgi:hypothetical protein
VKRIAEDAEGIALLDRQAMEQAIATLRGG